MPGMLRPEQEITWLPGNIVSVKAKSLISGETNEMLLPILKEQWDRWQAGEYIQTAMPHLDAAQREFLISGITPEEWAAEFKEVGDE